MSKTAEFKIWAGMRARCLPTNKRAKDYYCKGIQVCPRWDKSFEAFFDDMGPRPTPDHSIDRVNNGKGYSKENCRWATRKQQQRNRSTNAYVEINGEKHVLADVAEMLGIPVNCLTALKSTWTKKGKTEGENRGVYLKFL